MTITEEQLFSPKLISNVETVIVTCPNRTAYKFTKPEVFNTSTSVQEITFWVVSADQSPSDTNIHSIKKIAAKQSTTIKDLVGTSLSPGWSLVAKASENETANIKISARIIA